MVTTTKNGRKIKYGHQRPFRRLNRWRRPLRALLVPPGTTRGFGAVGDPNLRISKFKLCPSEGKYFKKGLSYPLKRHN